MSRRTLLVGMMLLATTGCCWHRHCACPAPAYAPCAPVVQPTPIIAAPPPVAAPRPIAPVSHRIASAGGLLY